MTWTNYISLGKMGKSSHYLHDYFCATCLYFSFLLVLISLFVTQVTINVLGDVAEVINLTGQVMSALT